ncbi:MAG: type II secretion system F family protein [Candidatus Woesearchaeota archaeon]
MLSYTKIAMRYLGRILEPNLHLFSDLKSDLKRSRMRISLEEYLSIAALTCIILFVIEFPLFSYILSLLKLGFFFSIFMSTTISIAICTLFFLIFLNYPKFIIREKSNSIQKTLPFAGIYLSAIASSGLPTYKIFEIFSKFDEYGEVSKEAKNIVNDMSAFGLSIKESLKKAVERTPSKELKELFWSILSVLESGGDLVILLNQKSIGFLNDYKRKLEEFSRSLTIYLEVYLTALVLGTIFFTILTSLMSGIGTTQTSIILIQFMLIFIFIPLISFLFIILIKSSSPGEG